MARERLLKSNPSRCYVSEDKQLVKTGALTKGMQSYLTHDVRTVFWKCGVS